VVWAPNERASVLPPAAALVPPEDQEKTFINSEEKQTFSSAC
jgi:hypothetical protein